MKIAHSLHAGYPHGDPQCTSEKFDAIDSAFNEEGSERVRFVVLPGPGHSVLTLDFVDEYLVTVSWRRSGVPR